MVDFVVQGLNQGDPIQLRLVFFRNVGHNQTANCGIGLDWLFIYNDLILDLINKIKNKY